MSKAEYTSNLESDYETTVKRRKKKRRIIYQSNASDEECTVQEATTGISDIDPYPVPEQCDTSGVGNSQIFSSSHSSGKDQYPIPQPLQPLLVRVSPKQSMSSVYDAGPSNSSFNTPLQRRQNSSKDQSPTQQPMSPLLAPVSPMMSPAYDAGPLNHSFSVQKRQNFSEDVAKRPAPSSKYKFPLFFSFKLNCSRLNLIFLGFCIRIEKIINMIVG